MLHRSNESDVMQRPIRIAVLVVLLLALGVFAVTEWLPALLFLPAAGGVLLISEYGRSVPGRSPRDSGHPRS